MTCVRDVDRVIRIFDALLRLAEIDSGMRRSGFVSLDLSYLAANAVEFYAPAAELKNIELKFRSDGVLPGGRSATAPWNFAIEIRGCRCASPSR